MSDESEVCFVVNKLLFKRRPKKGASQELLHLGVNATIKKARLNPTKRKYETYTYGETIIKATHFAKHGKYSHLAFENGMVASELKYECMMKDEITHTMLTTGLYVIICQVDENFVESLNRCDEAMVDIHESVQMVVLRNGRLMAGHLRRNGRPISIAAMKHYSSYIEKVFKIYKIL